MDDAHNTDKKLIARAAMVAALAHAEQTDKAGQPYLGHVQRVADRVRQAGGPAETVAVALLHDVLEDADVSVEELQGFGFPAEVIEAVAAITHWPGEQRAHYYARVAANPLARQVKVVGDLADNTDPERMAALDEPTRERLRAKYAEAFTALGAPVPEHLGLG